MAFGKRPSPRSSSLSASLRVRPQVETLEARIVPYALSGGAWPSPQLVTISFIPDGTLVGVNSNGYQYNNLFKTLNARFGSAAAWEGVVEKAAQTWAAVANVNFSVIGDNGTPEGQGPDQQGDPNMGDIRVSGYNFGYNWLGSTFFPPPVNTYSDAGDVQFNTSYSWHNGSTYDLMTVALHEMGHALGLGESAVQSAVMYATYTGLKPSLTTDDISGIQAIYGARAADVYNSGGASDATEASAAVLTPLIDPTQLTAVVPNLDLTSTTVPEWYTFTAPTGTSASLTVNIQSTGLSLLTPQATLYASDGTTVLATASGAGATDGTTLTLTAGNVTAGEQFYVKVSGADSTVFSIGEYALTLNFGTGPSPTVPLPKTTLADSLGLQGINSAELPNSFGPSAKDSPGGPTPAFNGPNAALVQQITPVVANAGPAGTVLTAAGPQAMLNAPTGMLGENPSSPAPDDTTRNGTDEPDPTATVAPVFFLRVDAPQALAGPQLLRKEWSRPEVPHPAGEQTSTLGQGASAFFAEYGAALEASSPETPAALGDGMADVPLGRMNLALLAGFVFGAGSRPAEPEDNDDRRRLDKDRRAP